jgi:hypothetical protein
MLTLEAIEWLQKHSNELPPEELPTEEEKFLAARIVKVFEKHSDWPIPKFVGPEKFLELDTQEGFNRIISDPNNWKECLEEPTFSSWVLPNATILFNKLWFDFTKWKSSVKNGVPFSMFSEEDKAHANKKGIKIDDTIAGKAMITRIKQKTEYALRRYLSGDWYSGSQTKSPSGYIIGSLKNEVAYNVGKELGYKQKAVLICPRCLATRKINNKKILTEHGLNVFCCDQCYQDMRNFEIAKDTVQKEYAEKFTRFAGTTCICPNDSCPGKFVPISFSSIPEADLEKAFDYKIRGNQTFKLPNEKVIDVKFNCPFCSTSFTPREALKLESGFNGKSGMITGLPKILIWRKMESEVLDHSDDDHFISLKDKLAGLSVNIDSELLMRQKLNLIVDNIVIEMSKLNKKTITGLTGWFFFKAAIEWMRIYPEDAYNYFFGWDKEKRNMTELELLKYPGQTKKNVTNVTRGSEIAIHQSFFQMWIKLIEDNIPEFTAVCNKIQSIENFKWFCNKKKYSDGPRSTFRTTVVRGNKINNFSNITGPDKVRLAKIYSIYKIEENNANTFKNYATDVIECDWQNVTLSLSSDLNTGDEVEVEALMMSGHPTHAPIQRILRLRSLTLNKIIIKILEEEAVGISDVEFWKTFRHDVETSRDNALIERL